MAPQPSRPNNGLFVVSGCPAEQMADVVKIPSSSDCASPRTLAKAFFSFSQLRSTPVHHMFIVKIVFSPTDSYDEPDVKNLHRLPRVVEKTRRAADRLETIKRTRREIRGLIGSEYRADQGITLLNTPARWT